jgi:FLVCR family MFS transporter 7
VEAAGHYAHRAMTDAYQVYSTRWWVLLFFSLNNATNAFLWICFSSIVGATCDAFAVSSAYVNGLSLAFLLLFLPGSIMTSYLMERYGLRVTMLAGSLLNCAGAWLRYAGALAAPRSPALGFGLLMLGQCVAAVGQPCFTNLPARISADWFPAAQRDVATVVASLSNALGVAAGSVVPTLAVASAGDVPAFMLGQAAACTVFLLGTWYSVRASRPPTPPSASSAARLRKGSVEAAAAPAAVTLASTLADMRAAYWGLLQERNYLFLMAGFGVGLGLFNALLTLLTQLMAPCGYGNDFGGEAGGVLLGLGLLSAAGVGVLMERTRAYVTTLRGGILLAVLASLFFLGSLRRDAGTALMVSCGVLGACLIPLLPISLENAAECTFPVPEEVSSGLLLIVGNYIGLALILVMQGLIPTPTPTTCATPVTGFAGVFLGVVLLACAALFLFQKDYRRQAAEAGEGGSSGSESLLRADQASLEAE